MSDAAAASWIQLTLAAGECPPDRLEDALLLAGAVAVTLQDAGDRPILEPLPGETPLWPRTRVTGLFSAQTDIEVVKQVLRQAVGSAALRTCRLKGLAERDWVRTWMEDYHPMRFGVRLWVCPRHQHPPEPDAVTVVLDPGLAFGTGTHPTTALCLEWLDGARLAGGTVVDYGCGSGILAIAAARLGASRVWAVDIDPQALLASARNAADNGVADRITLSAPEDLPAARVDILLANILSGPLIGLAPRFADLVAAHGRLVLSGILDHQADAVRSAFVPWFDFAPRRRLDDWVLLQATRRD